MVDDSAEHRLGKSRIVDRGHFRHIEARVLLEEPGLVGAHHLVMRIIVDGRLLVKLQLLTFSVSTSLAVRPFEGMVLFLS